MWRPKYLITRLPPGFLYLTIGGVGYLANNTATQSSVLNNLPDNWATHAVQASLALTMALSIPLSRAARQPVACAGRREEGSRARKMLRV